MKKKVLLALAIAMSVSPLFAKPVTEATAKKAALHFMEMKTGNQQIELNLFNGLPTKDINGLPAMYIYTVSGQAGFVVIAGDDISKPVLGYSTQHYFTKPNTNISPEASYWLRHFAKKLRFAQQHNWKASQAAQDQWTNLLQESNSAGSHNVAEKTTGVSPMLTTTWGQLPYYNKYCPATAVTSTNPTGHAPAGCVATAMAQIMKYWDNPTTGSGSHSYNSSTLGGTLSANFGATTYDWANMPGALTQFSDSTQINAVAKLIYHCGVAVDMDYAADGSGSLVINYGYSNMPCSQNAMPQYFGYKSTIEGYQRQDFNSATNWQNMLEFELDNGRPVLYTGVGSVGGHAFVFDGYNSSNEFHVNWGWQGMSNGYFTTTALNPPALGTGGGGGGFNSQQTVLIMIEPSGNTSTPNPYTPNGSAAVSFNLNLQNIQSSAATIHKGDAYQISAGIQNIGSGDFDQNNDGLFLMAVDAATQQQQFMIDQKAQTITAGSSYEYDYNSAAFNDLTPGNYLLFFGYYDLSSGNGQVITNNSGDGAVSLTVLPANTGVQNLENAKNEFQVFPNPASQLVYVKGKSGASKLLSVQLFDATGRMVYQSKDVSKSLLSIPVGNLASGLYQIRLITKQGSENQKILVRH